MLKKVVVSIVLAMALVSAGCLPACADGQMTLQSTSPGEGAEKIVSSTDPVFEWVRSGFERKREEVEREREERARQEAAERERVARERAEREERERQEAAERERARHEEEWRNRFPTDDYSNTLLIGDSIMQNAASALSAALPGVEINADAGRTLEAGGLVFEGQSPNCGVLDHVRNDDGSYERYVIGTGNNEVFGMSEDDAEEIVECLGPEKEVYFITMCSMGNMQGTEVTNESIESVVQRHENVHVIDWRDFIVGRESEFLSDGIHVQRSREPDYAEFIKECLDVIY